MPELYLIPSVIINAFPYEWYEEDMSWIDLWSVGVINDHIKKGEQFVVFVFNMDDMPITERVCRNNRIKHYELLSYEEDWVADSLSKYLQRHPEVKYVLFFGIDLNADLVSLRCSKLGLDSNIHSKPNPNKA